MNYKGLIGQSAIEYLMTYGWMLLVVAVTGGAIFSITGSQSLESSSGFSGEDVTVENFGLNNEGSLDIILRNTASENTEIQQINLSNNGETVSWSNSKSISVGDSKSFTVENVTASESTNSLDINVNYKMGQLTNMQASGQITGPIKIGNETLGGTEENVNNGGGSNDGGDGNEESTAASPTNLQWAE